MMYRFSFITLTHYEWERKDGIHLNWDTWCARIAFFGSVIWRIDVRNWSAAIENIEPLVHGKCFLLLYCVVLMSHSYVCGFAAQN